MEGSERRFALTAFGVHGMDHLLKRLFPPLVPIWAAAFGFPLWMLGLLLGANMLGSMGQAPVGVLSDRYDRRYLLPSGVAVVGVSILAIAAVPSLGIDGVEVSLLGVEASAAFLVMLAAMLGTGIGSSTVHPTGYPLITANVSPENKGKVLGMWGSASKFGNAAGPAMVGALLLATSWDVILVLFGLLALGYAALLFAVLGRFDTRPAGTDPDAPASTDAASRRVDPRVYLYPMIAVFVYFAVQIMAANGVLVFIPEFITSVYGYSVSVAGVTMTPEATASFYYSVVMIIAGVVQFGTGVLVDRYDGRLVLIGFLVAGAAVLGVLAFASLSPVGLFVVLGLLGATLWGLQPARDAIVSDIAPADREGRTFGYLWTGAMLASGISPVIVGYIGDLVGLRDAFAVLAAATVLSAVPIALLLSRRFYVDVDPGGASRAD